MKFTPTFKLRNKSKLSKNVIKEEEISVQDIHTKYNCDIDVTYSSIYSNETLHLTPSEYFCFSMLKRQDTHWLFKKAKETNKWSNLWVFL